MIRRPPRSTLFPYTDALPICADREARPTGERPALPRHRADGPRQPLRGDRLLPRGPEGRRQADRRVRALRRPRKPARARLAGRRLRGREPPDRPGAEPRRLPEPRQAGLEGLTRGVLLQAPGGPVAP